MNNQTTEAVELTAAEIRELYEAAELALLATPYLDKLSAGEQAALVAARDRLRGHLAAHNAPHHQPMTCGNEAPQ